MGKIFFFGYGANRDLYRLKEILGNTPEGGQGAFIEGFNLAVQNLDQIPPETREILRRVWGDEFHAYTLQKGDGFVEGRIWILDERDLEKLQQWEFVGDKSWRELITTTATTSSGEKITVLTEKSREDYPVEKLTDGFNYEMNINKLPKRYHSEEDEYKLELLRKEIRLHYGTGGVLS